MNGLVLVLVHIAFIVSSIFLIRLYRSKHQKFMTLVWSVVLFTNSLMLVLYTIARFMS